MDLSADHFIEIVTSLTEKPPEDATPDQRRQPRAGLRASGTIILLSEASSPAALVVQIRDLSPSGIGFLHDKKMNLDEQFALILARTKDTPSVVLCSVAFWQPLTRDLFAIGARFVRVLRDGGAPPLPIQIDTTTPDLAEEIERLHRIAS